MASQRGTLSAQGSHTCPICAQSDNWSAGALCARCAAAVTDTLLYEIGQAQAMVDSRRADLAPGRPARR